MTSKEKAKELFEKYSFFEVGGYTGKHETKDMCKLCVDEIIDQWEYIDTYISDLGGKLNPNLSYWMEVKSEIKKL